MPQPNMKQMLKQVQKMQQDMGPRRSSSRTRRSRPPPAAAWSRSRSRGDLVVKAITIDPEAIDPEDAELLQDMVLAAVNEGAARGAGARGQRRWAA